MKQSRLPYFLFVFLLLIFIFDFVGLAYDWYHTLWWFDIPMHIAGGAWVALAATYFLGRYYFSVNRASGPIKILLTLVSVMTIGILWEIFEYFLDVFVFGKYTLATVPKEIRTDSFYDLINDFLGAALVLGITKLFMHRKAQD